MNKLIISERQLNLITKNLVMEQDNELIAYCDCMDGTIQFACDDCEMCCVNNGGWDQGMGTSAQIIGMGDVSYSYDDGPIETTNSSSSFGYVPPN
tara:strand:+ start:158 stop:442 length:285 start_codon:yes stop_codon:yes gene_type:complete